MSKKEPKSFVLYEEKALQQIVEAKRLNKNAYHILQMFMCDDWGLKFKEEAVEVLTEYLTNTRFYANAMENYLFSDNIIKDKKTNKHYIVVTESDFRMVSSYLTIIAACENELETLGISVRLH